MVSQADSSSLFSEICRQTVDRGQFRFAWIGLLDHETGFLKPAASFGDIPGFLEQVRKLLSGPGYQNLPSYRAITENRTIVINDVENDPVARSWKGTALNFKLNALASTPIRKNGKIIGIITLYAYEPGCFGPREVELIDELAIDISFAIAFHDKEAERIAATEELQFRERRLRTLHVLDRIILAGQDEPEVMARVALEQLISLLNLDRGRIEICNEAGDLESVVRVPEVEKASINTSAGVSTGTIFTADATGGTTLRVPVGTDEKTMGNMFLYWNGQHAATPEEMEIAREMAGQVSIAFENTRLRKQAVRHANELENRVLERTAQLEAANRELEAFSYSVSHDLRSPLRALNGFSQMLLEGYGNLLDDEGRRMLNIIHSNASRMGNLINDLLALARIGRHEIVLTRIDMKKLARQVFDEYMESGDRNRMDFKLHPLPSAYGDETLLRQVWANLISNALKYTSKKPTCCIEIGFMETPFEIIYFLRDNGAGFSMEFADKLFGVFQRLHSPSDFDGTGVGLAIVKRIITRLDGRVWATGKVNEGATFYFALPGLAER
jgi:signal transduction histidine kinase